MRVTMFEIFKKKNIATGYETLAEAITSDQPTKKRQGFASMDPEAHRALASKGGRAKVAKGFAKFDREYFKEISSKGGKVSKRKPHLEGTNA